MNNFFKIKILFLLTLLTVCTSEATCVGSSRLETVLGDLNVLLHPSSVIMFTEDDKCQFILLNNTQIEDLKKIILDDQSYDFDLTKEAVFIPSIVFFFRQGAEEVKLILSHHAEQILFKNGPECIAVIDCDPCFDELVHLTQSFRRGE